MNAISKFGWTLALAAAIPANSFGGPAPYGNAVSKGMHPGKPHVTRVMGSPRGYVQPRAVVQPQYAQRQTNTAPRVAATLPTTERRLFSYEPGNPVVAAPQRTYSYEPAARVYVAPFDQRRTYSYEPAPVSVTPRAGRGFTHTYEDATMKGLGQVR